MLGRDWPWLRRTAQRFVEASQGKIRFRRVDVVNFLFTDPDFVHYWHELHPIHLLTEPERIQPVEAATRWNLPQLETASDLADWLWLDQNQLAWFADLRALGSKTSNSVLGHYHYRALPKRHAGFRIIEAPKRRLKSIQRQILEGILDLIPVHPAAHAFVKGRSILTFTAPHVGQPCVLRMDLQNFFPSFCYARIEALFRTLGYPEQVAKVLAGLCTNVTPAGIWRSTGEPLYARRHLPQGAPSSPALANLCAYRMDCRLAGLARSAGVQYSRYADDVAFSGAINFTRFKDHAASILLEEGFSVQHRKTRVMGQSVRQHLAGLVVNERANVNRRTFDELKGVLTNCVRHGLESQNREDHPAFLQHLEGRVGFVEMVNPAKGKRLRRLLNQLL